MHKIMHGLLPQLWPNFFGAYFFNEGIVNNCVCIMIHKICEMPENEQ